MIKPLLLFFVGTYWSLLVYAKGVFDEDILIPRTDFFTPKNIIFCTQGAGSSHHFWVLEMMKELHSRGHNVSFHTAGDQMVFGKDYPMIETFQLAQHNNFIVGMMEEGTLNHPSQLDMALSSVRHATKQYIRLFQETQDLIRERKVDLVIADAFALASADAAIDMKIPVALTSTFTTYPDSNQEYVNNNIYSFRMATINHESIYNRLYNRLYVPYAIWKTSRQLKNVMDFQRKLGFEPSMDTNAKRYSKVTKIVNNAFGLETSREMSQLVNMVGPILRTNYPNMDEKTATFLSQHNRTIYVAFGQHTVPSEEDVHLILYNLLKLKEEGYINGIIWARLDPNVLPQKLEIATKNSKFTISKSDLLNSPEFLILKWAPQYAILQHPSTVLFVGHGGIGSIHESLYSRVPLFIYSFFADQPYNGHMIQKLGVGEQIDTIQMKFTKQNYKIMYERLQTVLLDRDGGIAKAVDKFSNYLQIKSQNSIQRGADILEECVFASNDQGYLGHLQDIKYEINWIKRNSIDLYVTMFSLVGLSFVLISKLTKYLSVNNKAKTE
ncbi:glycosyltransferase family 1 protein [Backusella circina FSU 941]|nr:glycosyltransferase family 1 protein [Backusella circina FSU 941]